MPALLSNDNDRMNASGQVTGGGPSFVAFFFLGQQVIGLFSCQVRRDTA